MLTELVTNPRPYFAERVKYPRIRRQAIIVVIAGIVSHVWRLSFFDILGASSQYISSILIIFTFAGIVEFIAIWFVLTWVMQFVANFLDGDVRFGRLLRLTGYGFAPVIVGGAAWSVGRYIAFQGANPPEPPLRQAFQYEYESYTNFMGQFAGDPAIYAGVAVGAIFVLGAGYLWYQAVSVASELEGDRAAIPAGVAVALWLGYIFYTMV